MSIDYSMIELAEKRNADRCQEFMDWLMMYCDDNNVPWREAGFANYLGEKNTDKMIFLIKFLPWFTQYCEKNRIPYWREVGFKGHLLREGVCLSELIKLNETESPNTISKSYEKNLNNHQKSICDFRIKNPTFLTEDTSLTKPHQLEERWVIEGT